MLLAQAETFILRVWMTVLIQSTVAIVHTDSGRANQNRLMRT